VLHAGTVQKDGAVLTAGGRVLSVVARGGDIDSVAERAYAAAARISFAGAQYRRDIGHHARKR
jgi:phosphoribosylamine--glycine ligase